MLKNRDFRAYLGAEVSSEFGTMFTATAAGVLAVIVFDASAAEIGVVVAAGTVPMLLFGLLSGALADRIRRPRRTLMVCDASAAAALVVMVVGVWSGLANVWWLVGLNLVIATLQVVVGPIYFTHLTNLVTVDEAGVGGVASARAQLQVGQYAARLSGRAVAGPVVALAASLGLLIDAITYLISLTLLRLIRRPDGRHEPSPSTEDAKSDSRWKEVSAGAREMWRAPVLRSLSIALCVMGTAAGATGALAVPFLLRTLDLPVALFSLIFAASGAAGLVGSVVATRVVGRLPNSVLTVAAYAGAAASAVLLPMAGGSLPVAAVSAAAGIALPVFFGAIANVGLVGVMTTDVPEHVLGRVSATLQTVVTVAALTGALGGGVLGDVLGLRGALVLSSGVAVVGLLFLVPLLRTLWTDWRRPGPVGPGDVAPGWLASSPDVADGSDQPEPVRVP